MIQIVRSHFLCVFFTYYMHTKREKRMTTKKNRRKNKKTYKKRIKGGTPSASQRNYAEMYDILGDIMEDGEKYFIIDLFVENNWEYKKQQYIRTTAMATDDDLSDTEEM